MKSVAWILVIIISIITFKDVTTFVVFKANQGYIAAKLCVFKAEPENTCNGKCVLKKTLEKNDKEEQELPIAANDDRQINLFNQDHHLKMNILSEGVSSPPAYNNKYSFQYSALAFHPPKSS